MEDKADLIFGAAHVTMTPFSPATRRLSSSFVEPNRPVHSARRLAWVSLQGRLVNADDASSAKTVNGGFPPAQAVAWELFSPVQRFLIVAVIGVAVSESKKNAQIHRLQKSVQLRDQVLSTMQQKLDGLCDQLNNVKDCSGSESLEQQDLSSFLYDQNQNWTSGNKVTKASGDDFIQSYKPSLTNFAEQEERRMSDLSDWCSSVTSAAEIQMNNLAVEQDIYNLKRDCDDKDATIKELTSLLHSSNLVGSKRVAELEDMIKRKNGTITRLKKDIIILEQKVMNFARLQRPSFSSPKPPIVQIPQMRDNLVYDMESSTGPSSSSDSDNSPKDLRTHSHSHSPEILPQSFELDSSRNEKPKPTQKSSSSISVTGRMKEKESPALRSASPLKEISMNRKLDTVSSSSSSSSRLRRSSNSSANRRLNLSAQKRWT